MNTAINLALKVGLLTSSMAAIAYSIRAFIGVALWIGSWDALGLLAVYAGPLSFAAGLYLLNSSSVIASEYTDNTNA